MADSISVRRFLPIFTGEELRQRRSDEVLCRSTILITTKGEELRQRRSDEVLCRSTILITTKGEELLLVSPTFLEIGRSGRGLTPPETGRTVTGVKRKALKKEAS